MFKKSHGFSLFEVCVVLALVAIIASLGISHMSFFDRIMTRIELERLHATCLYVQRLAMATHEEHHVICDERTMSYRYHGGEHHLPKNVRFGCASGIKGSPSQDEHMVQHAITFKHNTIIMHPDGIISAGTIYLTDTSQKYMYALTCGVSQVSYIRKYQYIGGKWKLL